jgi:hypothetical protein
MILTIPLKWNPSDSRDVAGYKVRWGRQGKKTAGIVTVSGKATSLMLALNVPAKVVFEITVSAYDVAGNESTHTQLTSVYVG